MKPSQSELRAAVVDFCEDKYGAVKIRRALSAWGWDVTVGDIKPIVTDYMDRRKSALDLAIELHMGGMTGMRALEQVLVERGIKIAEPTLFRHLKLLRAAGKLAQSSDRPGARQRRPSRDIATNGRPIAFSGPMVRAILEGRKTQTRRIVKRNLDERVALGRKNWHCEDTNASLGCPYGQIGDRLWVRESFHFQQGGPIYDAAGGVMDSMDDELTYRADCAEDSQRYRSKKWKASLFMPRWASRILLEITDVRLERVKDITGTDAKCEGAPVPAHAVANGTHLAWARGWFRLLWGEINGTDSWDANPWVWVVEFKRIEGKS